MVVHEMYPYLHVRGAAKAIDFYREVFGAVEKFRLNEPGTGRVGHAELTIGGATLMLADEFPECGIVGPEAAGQTTVTIHLHVDDADEIVRLAAAAGAKVEREPEDHFYGERSGVLRDPFGHRWLVGHSIQQMAPDEMQRRYDEAG